MIIEFFMPMIPPTVTAQEKDVTVVNGKPVFYDPPDLVKAKNKLMVNLLPHRPEKPLDGALRLVVKWCFPLNGGKHYDGEYKYTKPDTDNLNKALKDIMEKLGFYVNDAKVLRTQSYCIYASWKLNLKKCCRRRMNGLQRKGTVFKIL